VAKSVLGVCVLVRVSDAKIFIFPSREMSEREFQNPFRRISSKTIFLREWRRGLTRSHALRNRCARAVLCGNDDGTIQNPPVLYRGFWSLRAGRRGCKRRWQTGYRDGRRILRRSLGVIAAVVLQGGATSALRNWEKFKPSVSDLIRLVTASIWIVFQTFLLR
jgi:hypothetical protein